MCRDISMIFGVIFVAAILIFCAYKFIEKEDLRNKIIKTLYQTFKAIVIFLTSMLLYSVFDVAKIISFMPMKNISLNISVYTLILALILSIIEIYMFSNSVKVNIVLSSKKNSNQIVKEVIKVSGMDPVKAYMIVTIEGEVEKLKGSKIEIQFPMSINAQIDTIVTDEKNKLIIDIYDLISTEGRTVITINLLKKMRSIDNEAFIEARLIKNNYFKNLFFINFNTNRVGLISNEKGES